MATMTFQGTSPSAGGDINAAPITDTFNHIMSTWNGNNADENNVDYTSVDGIMVLGQTQTATAVKSWENVSAAAGGIREVAQFGIDPSSGTAADNDGGRLVFYADDDGGNETDIGRFDWVLTDASNGSEDSKIDLAVITNGTLANEVSLTGAALYPSTDDGLALGIVNSNEWSDLFLASGSVINFNNSDVTITHSANTLTFSGGSLVVGVDDTGYDVKLFGATSGQYLLWDESADELVLAGDTKLSFYDAAGGENIIASSDGHLEINAGTTLDITAPTVDLNSSTEFNIDTAAYDLNASGAVTVDSAGISLDSSAASNFTTSGGALTISGKIGLNFQEDGADIITINTSRAIATANTASIDLDASGAIAINSSGGTLSVGNDNVDQVVNLATAGTRTLNVGINDGTDVTTIVSKGNITNTGTVTVGVDDTGHDVQFFGATSGQYVLWDESADELILAGDTKLSFNDAAGGENIIASSDGHLEINAGTTLDITAPTVDLNSSTEFNIDTAAYDLNASGAVTVDSAGISLDSSLASNFTTAGGALTLEGKTGLNLKEDGADVMAVSDARLITFPLVTEGAQLVFGHTAATTNIFGETPMLQVVGNDGGGSGGIALVRYESGTDGPGLSFCRSDNDTIGTHALVDDGDRIGAISWHGSDGNDFINQSAYIYCKVDGDGGNNEVPGRLEVGTTADGAASSTLQMKIASDGGVFMYNLDAASETTQLNINSSNEVHSQTSSRVYKEDEQNLEVDTSRIYNLNVKSFSWAENSGSYGMRDFGLIAEDAYDAMPEVVNLRDGHGPYSIRNSALTIAMLNEIQKLKKEVDNLKEAA